MAKNFNAERAEIEGAEEISLHSIDRIIDWIRIICEICVNLREKKTRCENLSAGSDEKK